MNVTNQWGLRNGQQTLAHAMYRAQGAQSSFSTRITMIWLVVTLAMLPVECFNIPFHMDMVDISIMMGLPVVWIFIILERQPINSTYALPIWLIFSATLIGAIVAPQLSNSIIVLLKEIYLFLFFLTLTAILSTLSRQNLRLVMMVWAGVVVLHGLLIIAEFLSTDLWLDIQGITGRMRKHYGHETYRPSGLFFDVETAGDANKASFFQMLGFVPLVAAKFSKKVTIGLGIIVLLSMICTGSMGALTALTLGLISTVFVVAVVYKRIEFVIVFFAQVAVVVSLLGVAYLAISQNQAKEAHLEKIVEGRAGKSSEGRFALWQRGLEELQDTRTIFLGIGPENFRVVDFLGKQLHNDSLAFLVERGLIGLLGFWLLCLIALSRAVYILLIYSRYPGSPLHSAIFFWAIMTMLAESLTHQIFHAHQLWMVLALQEAMLFRFRRGISNIL